MNLPGKIFIALRDLLLPGPQARFDHRRSLRTTILGILVGIVLAVAFGFLLYYLNRNGRINR
jgi:peptidoglycan biosynthesis protein MviN/MurJ (putative lipid II flippase)